MDKKVTWNDEDVLHLYDDDAEMSNMLDLWSEEIGMRTDMGSQTEMEMESAATQATMEVMTEKKSMETQAKPELVERGMQTDEMDAREVKVVLYKSVTLTEEKKVQTERSEAKSAKSTGNSLCGKFLNEGSVISICNDLGEKINENMRWRAEIGERFNLGYWKEPFEGYRLIAEEWKTGRSVVLEKKEDVDKVQQFVKILGKFLVKNLFRGGGYITYMALETIGKPNLYFANVTTWEYKLGDTFKANWTRTLQDRYMLLELGDRLFGQDQKKITTMEMEGQNRRQSTMRDRY